MAALKARLTDEMTTTLKSTANLTGADRDQAKLAISTLRMVLAAISKAEVAGKTAKELTDDEILALLKTEVKKRKESAEAFTQAGRTELAEKESAEAAILSVYLPELLDEAATRVLVTEVIADLGITDPKQRGRIMGAFKGRKDLDMGLVARIVGEALA